MLHTSPLVYQCSWGRVEVEQFGWFKDVVLTPGNAESWDWAAGQTHDTAVSANLVQRVHGEADIIVIGLGMETRVRVQPDVLRMMAGWRNVFLSDTPRAVIRYNEFAQDDRRVALILHSTC